MSIRNAAKALIVKNDKILLNKCLNSTGYSLGEIHKNEIYFDLPGGGQQKFETLEETIKRECIEETGYHISVDKLVAIYEEIYMSKNLKEKYPNYVHKIFFVFICHVLDEDIEAVTNRDIDQIESEWIDIMEISNINLYPKIFKANIENLLNTEKPILLGSQRI